MIKTIGAMGGIGVEAPPPPYINNSPNSGTVRYNTMSQNLEVFDGYSWINISTHAQFSLSPEVCKVFDWAAKRMKREQEIEEYAERYPIVASVKAQLDNIQEQMDVTLALVSDLKP